MTRVLAIAASLLLITGCNRGDHPGQIGSKAPDFNVSDGDTRIHLSDYKGQVVILNFWATWCAPCLDELPSLQRLQAQMPNVRIIAVSIDDDADAYRSFKRQYNLNLQSVRDGSEGANLKFGSVRVPETFVLDRSGVMRRKFVGAQDWTNPEIINYLSKL